MGRARARGRDYFHNDLSNVIGFNGLFETLNLGSAMTQGVESEIKVTPIRDLTFTGAYTYLDTEKTSALDIASRKEPGCRGGRATNSTSRLLICGARNCGPPSRQSS